MPFLELLLPTITREVREKLAAGLNEEFIAATGFEDEVLNVRFSEYAADDLAVKGQLGSQKYVRGLLFSPRLRYDIKRNLASILQQTVQSAIAGAVVELYLSEFPYENMAIEGQLLSDADEELSSRPYYYVLPR